MSKENPGFLFVEIAQEHSNQVAIWSELARVAQAEGAGVLAAGQAGRVACLEPGTVGAGMLIARWRDAAALTAVAEGVLLPWLKSLLPSTTVPLILRVNGLPEQGLPELMDIPTVASVPVPPSVPRNAFLVVRGSAWDQARLDQYRDVILPMHKERGGYYEAFAVQPGEVTALSGVWTDQIFAISRWPSRAVAEDFWYCDRYQTQAIPLRLGAGRFTVHMLDAS